MGAPTFTAGQIGQAMRFITTNDLSVLNYVTLGYPMDLQFGTNSFSVGFWIKYSAQGDDPAFLSNKDWGSSSNPGWGLFAQNGGNFRVNATGTPGGSGNRMSTTNGLSPLPVLGLSRSGNSVKLEWIGGLPPFNVEWKKKLSDGWAPAGTTSNHSLTITMDGDTGTFRVGGSGQ